MEKFVIEGGHQLSGSVTPGGSKNEALPCLAASLLTDEEVTFKNIPRINDVEVMLQVIEDLGGWYEWVGDDVVKVRTENVEKSALDTELCKKIRASILFAGAMLGRRGRCELPPPGGDVIGRRRLDSHFLALESLGASIDVGADAYVFETNGLEGTEIFLDEASVTGTENAIMAAVAAKGKTTIRNAACEPHVQGLCRMLVSMGARIQGIGTNILHIEGAKSLWGCEHTIGPDYLEIGSFAGLAAVTNSVLTIKDVVPEDLRMIRLVFEKLGVQTDLKGRDLIVHGDRELKVQRDLHGAIPKIDDAPWPAFPTDLMSIAITVATQCDGTILFFEKMFEGRMFFVDSLIGMGAQIVFCDPHRVVVVGPSQLYGATLESPDIRAGMALLLAALAAKGESTIYNVRQIDRGYANIDEKLTAIGAQFERLPVE
ncbi:UDP-N-acetylglucosamine 1-carboxyvinyltransferase [Persicimonas caeni]|jgi:UDP-N-acetylglucosamine 1-carboxyvinyltransferase|uniref:UDP-N-acetylglucosamine 1-carboxyvinyltransferase n=1 Tax=Persicimonas caeni TaxID=2292766 RepID=A0A4Y6PYQ1_PERCE|nr:UDP-N-acetylglucosamine 1-carboxyvinyltransferase [Persicimonas caeni]QDG53289.1 UDP-N-acetylglucosamine 1-carboxyvinyltransferase [Persicimonas caeni]QED34511.1 UDP-N-acetylglucosamine 1-carboxyvinyltransferase [Persicimonas caeni]